MRMFCRFVWQGLTVAGVSLFPVLYPTFAKGEEIDYTALVRAISAVESGGNPRAVGAAGERGLMQIKQTTWREITEKTCGEHVPFARAFEPELNQQVGLAYLEQLTAWLTERRERVADDLLPVLVAAYHCGPGLVESAGYATKRLSPEVRDYVSRVINLHWLYSDGHRLVALDKPSLPHPPSETVTKEN